MKSKDGVFRFLISKAFEFIDLEINTLSGKVNCFFAIILIVFILAYSASDSFMYFISSVKDCYQSTVLKTNISNPVLPMNIIYLLLPIIIFMILCIGFLAYQESKIKKLK